MAPTTKLAISEVTNGVTNRVREGPVTEEALPIFSLKTASSQISVGMRIRRGLLSNRDQKTAHVFKGLALYSDK